MDWPINGGAPSSRDVLRATAGPELQRNSAALRRPAAPRRGGRPVWRETVVPRAGAESAHGMLHALLVGKALSRGGVDPFDQTTNQGGFSRIAVD
jgi:hypothetical protein